MFAGMCCLRHLRPALDASRGRRCGPPFAGTLDLQLPQPETLSVKLDFFSPSPVAWTWSHNSLDQGK